LANVLDKVVRGGPVALAGAIGDDGAARGGQRDKGVLVTLLRFVGAGALLLLANECPQLVQPQTAGANANKAAIVQFGAAHADLESEPADCFAVDADQARGRADADALIERGDALDLLVSGENVRGRNPSLMDAPQLLEKQRQLLYIPRNGHLTFGAQSRWFGDRGPAPRQRRRSHGLGGSGSRIRADISAAVNRVSYR
jgi:hypothetical protein